LGGEIAAARSEGARAQSSSMSSKGERPPPAGVSRGQLVWILGWPPIFIAAFVASALVHHPSTDEALCLCASTTEWALFLVGFWSLVIWILGSLFLAIRALVRSVSG
jgi:hypothetical protein